MLFNLFAAAELSANFVLLMKPYTMLQVFILFSVINQTGRNVVSMFYFYVYAETLAVTCRTLRSHGTQVEKHCPRHWRI